VDVVWKEVGVEGARVGEVGEVGEVVGAIGEGLNPTGVGLMLSNHANLLRRLSADRRITFTLKYFVESVPPCHRA
jgi:hypothetical protein